MKATLKKDWYEKVWKGWDVDKVKIEKEYGNHPFGGGTTITYKGRHPDVMLEHPFYKKWIETPRFQAYITPAPKQKEGFKNFNISNHDLLDLPNELNLIDVDNVLERYSYNDVADLLVNWYDKLKIEGAIHITTSNIKAIAQQYIEGKITYHQTLQLLYSTQLTNDDFYSFLFDETTLKSILEDVGFEQVKIEKEGFILKAYGRKQKELISA